MIKSKTMLAVLLLTAGAQGVWGWSGSGTEGNPYLIESAADWNVLAQSFNSSKDDKSKFYKLNNNIDFKEVSKCESFGIYVGAGSKENKAFIGIFDGNGHTITNFQITGGVGTYQGLFGYIGNNSTVKNLVISNLTINVAGNAGAVAGRNEGTIEDIIISQSTIEALNNALGGIAGNNYNEGIIQNCHVLSDVTIKCSSANTTKCGGIVGNNSGSYILNCSCAANISKGSTTNNSSCYGGIAGFSDKDSSIENCLFLGENVANIGYYGSIEGKGLSKYSHNYYTQTDIKGVTKSEANNCPNDDVTADDGAVPALRNNSDNATALGLLKDRFDFLTSKNVTNENHTRDYSMRLYDRTLYKDGYWNTLCLPFDVTATQIATSTHPLYNADIMELDVDGWYDNEGYRYDETATGRHQTGFEADGTLYLYFKNATKIEACVPYIVRWNRPIPYTAYNGKTGDESNATTCSDIVNPQFTFSEIEHFDIEPVTSNDGKVRFIGNFDPVPLIGSDKSNLYLGNDNTLYYPSSNVTINTFRAYFHVDLSSEDPATNNEVRAITLNFSDGETSGIVDAKANPSLSEWYSLSGRRYATPTALPKGVYIHNGRKVVIK